MADWQSEYSEAYKQFRQIDARIWGIYTLYATVVVAAAGYLGTVGKGWSSNSALTAVVLGLISIVTLAEFALIGHLQWYSDLIADRIREIERVHGLHIGRLFESADEDAARLWGPHRWFMKLRARDVMQMVGLLVLFACTVGSIAVGYKALAYNWGSQPSTDAILVICGTILALAFVGAHVLLRLSKDRLCNTALRHGSVGTTPIHQVVPARGMLAMGGSIVVVALAFALPLDALFLKYHHEQIMSKAGLILELLGAILFVGGELRVQASRIRQEQKAGRKVASTPYQWLPVWIAGRLGSPHAQDSQESVVESLTSRFWGLSLVVMGFSLQVLGIVGT